MGKRKLISLNPAQIGLGFMDLPVEKVKVPIPIGPTIKSIDKIVLNNEEVFGFRKSGVENKIAGYFRMRKRDDLEDYTNFDIIKKAYRGYRQIEISGSLGVPIEVLQRLNTYDIIALYCGIDALKGNLDLSGFPFGKLISRLIGYAYKIGSSQTPHGIRDMKNTGVGFTNHNTYSGSIEVRMEKLDENVKKQFMRSFFTPRFYSQEERPQGWHFHDEVYGAYHQKDGKPINSTSSREAYVHSFIRLLASKSKTGNDFGRDFADNTIPAWFVDSKSKQGLTYFVYQDHRNPQKLHCTCPHGFGEIFGLPRKGNECDHKAYIRTLQINPTKTN